MEQTEEEMAWNTLCSFQNTDNTVFLKGARVSK